MTRWRNYLEDHETHGTRFRPKSPKELLSVVKRAAAEGRKVRAVGSGHSSSEVAKPVEDQWWVDVSRLDDVLDWPFYTDTATRKRHVRVEAGVTVAELNERLDELKPPRALYNMGNYDGQTIAGAFCTGTHGSGIRHGTIADRIAAIELVTDEQCPVTGARVQRFLRLEPEAGVSDPQAFLAGRASFGEADDPVRGMTLEQDDDAFRAALSNLGCFGIVYAVTLEVRERFWLREHETFHEWKDVGDLAALAAQHPEFLQITLVPHAVEREEGRPKQVVCLKTWREEIPVPVGREPTSRDPAFLTRMLAAVFSTGLLENLGLHHPRKALGIMADNFESRAERSAEAPHESVSHQVLVTSLAPQVDGTSCEIFVPLEEANAALDTLIALARERETLDGHVDPDEWFHTSPVGVRFVGRSHALLAPSCDGPRCAIEVPLFYDMSELPSVRAKHDRYRDHMLATIEKTLCEAHRGRPHWGQRNWMDGHRAAEMYGENWTKWKAQYARFNAFGTFSNDFTARMGLTGR